jgi:hypothetical protein
VPLENLFDQNAVPVKLNSQSEYSELIDCNLGTEKEPKFVSFSKHLKKNRKLNI